MKTPPKNPLFSLLEVRDSDCGTSDGRGTTISFDPTACILDLLPDLDDDDVVVGGLERSRDEDDWRLIAARSLATREEEVLAEVRDDFEG